MRKVSMRGKSEITVTETIDNFLRKCTARNLSHRTITMYGERLRAFRNFTDDDTMLVS
ncbi:MAG: hypothetical protein FWC89_04905 [Defluviitaleaceae bacterium]|nr:hypothetical protein [Defluviitaleaceae bacterium]